MKLHLLSVALICFIFSQPTRAQETEAPDSSTDPPPSTQEPHEALKEDEAESSTAAGIFDDLISNEPPQDLDAKDIASVDVVIEPRRPCTTHDGKLGQCKNLINCRTLTLSLNNLRQSVCFQTLFVPGVCCPDPIDAASTTTTTTTTTTAAPTSEAPSSQPETSAVVVEATDQSNGTDTFNFIKGQCGHVTPMRRIVGGEISTIGAWPWMVAIFLRRSYGLSFRCGGTIINDKYVLTAAHCMMDSRERKLNPSVLALRFGDYNLRAQDVGETELFDVESIKVHPWFLRVVYYNDVALLKMVRQIPFSQYISPVCIPAVDEKTRTYETEASTVIGWGTTSYGGRGSPLLREVTLPIWKNRDCDRKYLQPITRHFLCAGYQDGGKDSCQGDSGGPLLVNQNNRWVQIGIVSFGNQCAQPGIPGVYTRVTHFVDWINSNAV